jgi:hypothetical protein
MKRSMNEMIRDRIVVGIQDRKLSERLQLDATRTLEKAIATVGSWRQLLNLALS